MKILYLHQHFCTPQGHSGTRSYEFAKRWVNQNGDQVLLVSGMGYDPTFSKQGKYNIEGIQVNILGVKYKNKMSKLSRIFSFLAFAFKSLLFVIKNKDYDIIFATSTPLTIAIPALTAKFLAGKPLVFEVRDVWPDAAIEAKSLKNPIVIWFARWLERLVYKKSEHIIALSTGMRDRICTKGDFKVKISVIPNCCDDIVFISKSEKETLRKQNNSESKFVIIYAGAISLANNIEQIVEILKHYKNDNGIEFWFIGGGNKYSYLSSFIEEENIANTKLFGQQPKDKVFSFLQAADAGLVTFINEPVYYENSPNKFFDYITSGLPVIFNRSTWLEEYIEKYNVGIVAQSGELQDITSAIDKLRSDSNKRKTMGVNARELSRKVFSRNQMANNVRAIFDKVLDKKTEDLNIGL